MITAICFGGGVKPFQLGIEVATAGKYSHCWVDVSNGGIIDSSYDNGVSERAYPPSSLYWWRDRFPIFSVMTYEQSVLFEEFIRSQIGKDYDMGWIFGFVAHRDWQADDSWVCSELIAAALEYAGVTKFRKMRRVTPRTLHRKLVEIHKNKHK